jgi:hypothetical protein
VDPGSRHDLTICVEGEQEIMPTRTKKIANLFMFDRILNQETNVIKAAKVLAFSLFSHELYHNKIM